MPNFPNKPKFLKRGGLVLFIAFVAVMLAISAYLAWRLFFSARRVEQVILESQIAYMEATARESLYESVAPTPAIEPEPNETPAPTPAATPEPTAHPGKPTPKPTREPMQIRQRFLDLMDEYDSQDIVGYLRIDGTSVDYIVVQAKDNDFYLVRDIHGNLSDPGWIFMDFRNDPASGEDPNTILYGHNMRRDIMFHSLRYYRDYNFFASHPVVSFDTLYEDGVWEIFSFMRTDIKFYYIQTHFKDRDEFFEMATKIKDRSLYDTGVEIFPDDRILLLSTCTNETEDTRFVLAARLVRNGPDETPRGRPAAYAAE